MNLHPNRRKAITRTVSIGVAVILILAAVVGIYYVTVTQSSSSLSSSSQTSSGAAAGYKSTIIIGTTDSLGCACDDPAKAYDYFGGDWLPVNLGAPLVDFAPGTTDTSPS